MRIVGWFSAGAASAIACALAKPDVIAYCDTGSEHADNARFMADCEAHFGWKIERLKSPDYADTWDVWQRRQYMSGHGGAPCTRELKIKPRLAFEHPDDMHVFGYTADRPDMNRAEALRENWPDMVIWTPLIDQGITKHSCRAMLAQLGISEPVTYAMGFPHANCLNSGCVKATSPRYWSLYRKMFPENFNRMARMSRELGVRLTRIDNERIFIDEIPVDFPVTEAEAPACDFLCQLASEQIGGKAND